MVALLFQSESIATDDVKALQERLQQTSERVVELEQQLMESQSRLDQTATQLAEREEQIQQVGPSLAPLLACLLKQACLLVFLTVVTDGETDVVRMKEHLEKLSVIVFQQFAFQHIQKNQVVYTDHWWKLVYLFLFNHKGIAPVTNR